MTVKLGAWFVAAVLLTYLAITTIITLCPTTPTSVPALKPIHVPHTYLIQASPAHENLPETALPKRSIYVDREHHDVIVDNTNGSATISKRNVTTHVAFLKVYKTASTTAQNIFLRFGDSRNLTFVLPHTYGESKLLETISCENSITVRNIVPPPPNHHYDILCCHVIYDRKSFESVLPADTAYVGIVREPISRFKSAMHFFSPDYILEIKSAHPVSQYVDDPMKYEPNDPRQSWTNNRMAVEFGIPLGMFPGNNNTASKAAINQYLEKLEREFDFIIVSEYFDESMILMRRLLGWTLKDVLYMNHNVKPYSDPRKAVQDADIPKLKQFLELDQAVYQFALKRFKQLKQSEGEDFIEEVNFFKGVLKLVNVFCHEFRTDGKTLRIQESSWNTMFEVTKDDCKKYKIDEKSFIQNQRMRMYGTLDN